MYNQYNFSTQDLSSQKGVQTDFKSLHFHLSFSGVALVWTTSERSEKSAVD